MKRRIVLSIGLGFLFMAGSSHAEGDAEQGQRAFAQCVACHSVEAGQNRVGPSLHDIMGQPAASVEGFAYSDALQNADLTWDDETMAEFLRNPRQVVPGTKMAFGGLKNEERIANIIAYLRQISEE